MKHLLLHSTLFLSLGICATAQVPAVKITPGTQHLFSHEAGNVPADTYQYSLYVPKDYVTNHYYPVVIFLHGGEGRKHPSEGTRNMIADRLTKSSRWSAPGYTGNIPNQFSHGYLHVAPVKPGTRWEADKFKRMLDHVKGTVNIDAKRFYVIGYSMGGQGAWLVAGAAGVEIAAMIPIGAWGCDEVKRGNTPETCLTAKTPAWVQHCPYDDVSKISGQISLYQNHLDCGGYGRFTMSPGKGHHDWPGSADNRHLGLRMEWLLAQTYGTPANYFVQVDGGIVLQFESGERGHIGDSSRHGFFEPGSVIRVTAPATRDGKPFVKWASVTGKFADPAARTATYTTAASDAQLMPIYGNDQVKLTVTGGTANPAAPKPGDAVTITAEAASGANSFLFWTTGQGIDIAHPHQRSVTFIMPPRDVTFTAKSNVAE